MPAYIGPVFILKRILLFVPCPMNWAYISIIFAVQILCMISFFQKKIYLADYLHGLVDIHNHIIPGIDDGAKTVDESKLGVL